MLVIIYPTGTKRSIHLNHFIVEAEKADPDCKVITTDEFKNTHYKEWPNDTKFIIRVGSQYIQEILPILNVMWHNGLYTIFPNLPSIKKCLKKGIFSEICRENNVLTPDTTYFAKEDEEHWRSFPFWKWGLCAIKPSVGSLGSGIYFVEGNQVPSKIQEIISTEDEFYVDCDIVVQKRIINKEQIPQSIRIFCFNGEPTCGITLTNSPYLQEKARRDLKVDPDILYDEQGNILDSIGHDIDFDTVSNLNKGGVAGPYYPDEHLKDQCRKICKATGIEFTTIDFVQDETGKFYCLEANIAPHLYRGFIIFGGKINHPKMIFDYLLDNKNKDSIML